MNLVYISEDFHSQMCSSIKVYKTLTTAVQWCKSKIKPAIFIKACLYSHSYRTRTITVKMPIFTTQLLLCPIIRNQRGNQNNTSLSQQREIFNAKPNTELLPISFPTYVSFLSYEKEKENPLEQQKLLFIKCLVLARTFANHFIYF